MMLSLSLRMLSLIRIGCTLLQSFLLDFAMIRLFLMDGDMPRMRPYRPPNRNLFFEGVTSAEDSMGSTKFPDGIDLFGDRSEPEMLNLAHSLQAFQLKAVKGEFSARKGAS